MVVHLLSSLTYYQRWLVELGAGNDKSFNEKKHLWEMAGKTPLGGYILKDTTEIRTFHRLLPTVDPRVVSIMNLLSQSSLSTIDN